MSYELSKNKFKHSKEIVEINSGKYLRKNIIKIPLTIFHYGRTSFSAFAYSKLSTSSAFFSSLNSSDVLNEFNNTSTC